MEWVHVAFLLYPRVTLLDLEYSPDPPFDCGSPKGVAERLLAAG